MIEELGKIEQPTWLKAILSGEPTNLPPMRELLDGSLYYPACRFDGRPIQFLAGNVLSFVYADYAVSREELKDNLRESPPRGYSVVRWQSLSVKDLGLDLNIGQRPEHNRFDPNLKQKLDCWATGSYCDWLVFKRASEFGEEHGPTGFSLLYLAYEAVAAFQALYVANGLTPRVIAIIQPGTGFGGNWTDFGDRNGPLATKVMDNPVGSPSALLYGGNGVREGYKRACWPEFDRPIGFLGGCPIAIHCR